MREWRENGLLDGSSCSNFARQVHDIIIICRLRQIHHRDTGGWWGAVSERIASRCCCPIPIALVTIKFPQEETACSVIERNIPGVAIGFLVDGDDGISSNIVITGVFSLYGKRKRLVTRGLTNIDIESCMAVILIHSIHVIRFNNYCWRTDWCLTGISPTYGHCNCIAACIRQAIDVNRHGLGIWWLV